MEFDAIYTETLEWEALQLELATTRAFKTQKTYRCPRRKKLKEYRRRKRGCFTGAKTVLKRNRNNKIRHLSINADGLIAPGEFRKIALSFWNWI